MDRRGAGKPADLPAGRWQRKIIDRNGRLMGTDDKIRNKAEELKGKAKERAGEATDNEQMEGEGKVDKTKANLKQAGEKAKDAFKE